MDISSNSTLVRDVAAIASPRRVTTPHAASPTSHGDPATPRNGRRDKLISIVERTGAGLAVVDPALRIQDNNRALLEQCGHAGGTVLGRNLCDLLHPSVRQYMVRRFERLIQRRNTSFVEHLAALWERQSKLSGTVTGIADYGPGGQVESILLLVNSEETQDDRRTLISPTKILTKINAQILEGVAAGAPTVQLASRLYLSRQGVEYHVSNLLRQFKVPNRAALVSKTYSMGLFKIGSWPPEVLTDFVRG